MAKLICSAITSLDGYVGDAASVVPRHRLPLLLSTVNLPLDKPVRGLPQIAHRFQRKALRLRQFFSVHGDDSPKALLNEGGIWLYIRRLVRLDKLRCERLSRLPDFGL